jgi:hypothetical protein
MESEREREKERITKGKDKTNHELKRMILRNLRSHVS